MKRSFLIVDAILAVLVCAAGIVLISPAPDERVSIASCARIQLDMTKAQAEEIFGSPPHRVTLHGGWKIPHTCETWYGDGMTITLVCDPQGKIVEKHLSDRPRVTYLQRLHRRLRSLIGF